MNLAMTLKDLYERLCTYDKRNPHGTWQYLDKDDPRPEPGDRTNCACDNCFYGRDEMARGVLQLIEDLDKALDSDKLCRFGLVRDVIRKFKGES